MATKRHNKTQKVRTRTIGPDGFYRSFFRGFLCLFVATVLPSFLLAQPVGDPVALRGQSDQTAKRLQETQRKLLDGKAAESLEQLQRVLDEAGDDLVPTDSARTQFRPARQVVQRMLTQLPPDVLRTYRDRIDTPAKKLLDAAKKDRDPRPLFALLDRYFVSRPAEEALVLLGELAFERGEFRAAEGYWRRLLPNAAEASYPDPRGDAAAVRARVALAVIFQNDALRAFREVEQFKKDFPKATGRLAGKDGLYAETLAGLLTQPPVLIADRGDGAWTGFAGGPDHSGKVSGRLPRFWPGVPTWKTPLRGDPSEALGVLPKSGSVRTMAFHPVVQNGIVYVADAVRVMGYDVRTGAPRFTYDVRTTQDGLLLPRLVAAVPPPADADYTLSAANGRLYARLGDPKIVKPLNWNADNPTTTSLLVCLAPPATARTDPTPLERRWALAPPVPKGVAATWEAAPLWADGKLYAAFARFDGTRMTHAIACYHDHDPPGEPIWVAEVAEGPEDAVRVRHEPVTLANGNVVFCTHTGLVTALDARTGKPAWAYRYPRPARAFPPGTIRDLCPPLADAGRVFVAPADGDAVFALDADTGRELWRSGPVVVDQLLGVSRGRLVVTVSGNAPGLRGLSIETGLSTEPDGWASHDDANLRSHGRGLVSDDVVLWPTNSGLFPVSTVPPSDGLPAGKAIDPQAPQGNLAFADGVLFIATPTELRAYVADRVELPARRAAARARPHDAEAQGRYAFALADAELWTDASNAIRKAELVVDVHRVRADWLAVRVDRALAQGKPIEARRLLRDGMEDEYPFAWRVRSAGRLLTLTDDPDTLVCDLDKLGWLDTGFVRGPDGIPLRLREFVARHIEHTPPVARPVPKPVIPKPTALELFPQHGLSAEPAVKPIEFPSAQFVPLIPFGKGVGPRLFVADGKQLLVYDEGEAEPTWEADLPDGLRLTHAAVVENTVVVAGPNGAMRLRLRTARPLWTFVLPDAEPLPGPGLSHFALAGLTLVTRVGDQHLLAINANTGSVAWAKDTLNRNRLGSFPLPGAPRFGPHMLADAQAVVVQLSTGKRIAYHSATGELLHGAPTSEIAWDGPPVRLADGSVAVGDGPDLARGIDPTADRTTWFLDFMGEASSTGRPPTFRPLLDGAIAAVSRNHGVELYRLSGGLRVWRRPTLVPVGELDLAAADADAERLYVPAEGMLFAFKLTDGSKAWSVELPSRSSWRVRAGRKTLAVYPTDPIPIDAPGPVFARQAELFTVRAAGRLPALSLSLYDAWATRTVPVLLFDSENGELRRHLDLASGPMHLTQLGPDACVVATTGKAYWLK